MYRRFVEFGERVDLLDEVGARDQVQRLTLEPVKAGVGVGGDGADVGVVGPRAGSLEGVVAAVAEQLDVDALGTGRPRGDQITAGVLGDDDVGPGVERAVVVGVDEDATGDRGQVGGHQLPTFERFAADVRSDAAATLVAAGHSAAEGLQEIHRSHLVRLAFGWAEPAAGGAGSSGCIGRRIVRT